MDGSRYNDDPLEVRWTDGPPSLGSLLRSARRQAPLVALCVALCVGAALFLMVLSQPIYTARLALELNTGSGEPAQTRDMSAMDLDTHVELLRSDSTTARVVRQLDLAAMPDFAPSTGRIRAYVANLRARLEGESAAAAEEPVDQLPGIIRNVSKGLSVTRVGDTRVIELRYRSPSPKLAASIADAYAKVYLGEIAGDAEAATERRIERLGARGDEMLRRAAEAETRIQQIMQEPGALAVDPQDLQKQTADLRQQLSNLEVKTAALSTKLAQIGTSGEAGDASALAVDTPEGRRLLKELALAEERLSEARRSNAAPAVVESLEAGLERLRGALRQEVRLAAKTAEVDLDIAVAERVSLLFQLGRLRDYVSSDTWANLEAARNEKLYYQHMYEDYLTRLEEARREPRRQPGLRVVADALVPLSPSAPNEKVVLAIAMTLGGILGVGLATLREWNRYDRFRR